LAVGKALLAKPQFPVVKRHIEQEAHCETCGVPEESIQHVLLEWTVARIFWAQTRSLTGVKIPNLHPATWARDLLVSGAAKDRAIIMCVVCGHSGHCETNDGMVNHLGRFRKQYCGYVIQRMIYGSLCIH
jgi:hypothetical protein